LAEKKSHAETNGRKGEKKRIQESISLTGGGILRQGKLGKKKKKGHMKSTNTVIEKSSREKKKLGFQKVFKWNCRPRLLPTGRKKQRKGVGPGRGGAGLIGKKIIRGGKKPSRNF